MKTFPSPLQCLDAPCSFELMSRECIEPFFTENMHLIITQFIENMITYTFIRETILNNKLGTHCTIRLFTHNIITTHITSINITYTHYYNEHLSEPLIFYHTGKPTYDDLTDAGGETSNLYNPDDSHPSRSTWYVVRLNSNTTIGKKHKLSTIILHKLRNM